MRKFAITLLLIAVLTLGLAGTATAGSAPSASGRGGTVWAFNAIQVDASTGAARGQIQYVDVMCVDTISGLEAHGKVLYLAVNGNNAWIGFVVTQSNYAELVGTEWVLEVQDNGEGKGATGPDLVSGINSFPASYAVAQPDFSPGFTECTLGNIQVFPG